MEAAAAQQPKYVSPKGMWVSKLVLRIISVAISSALIGVTVSMFTSDLFTIIPFIVVGPPAIVALCWEIAEGICILARGGHRGIHPGANVALDLLLWLGLAATVATLGVLGVAEATLGSLYEWGYYGRYSSVYEDLISEATTKGQAALGLGSLLTLLHFTTFVIACYECSVRNSMTSTRIIYVTAPAPYDPSAAQQQAPTMMQPVYFQPANAQQQFHPIPLQQPPYQQYPQYHQPQAPQYQVRESVVSHEIDSQSPFSQPSSVYSPPEKHAELQSPEANGK